ncbi:MAG: DUF4065 domain-containing protein, partial [Sediminibacterium sp.]|nr:DUF4065 domain-containing protein [Sediminibacterium sp.]
YSLLESRGYIASKFIPLPNGAVREVFIIKSKEIENTLSDQEMKTVSIIIKKFSNTPTWNIVELSHKEKAWKEMVSKPSCISYQQYAFDLQTV